MYHISPLTEKLENYLQFENQHKWGDETMSAYNRNNECKGAANVKLNEQMTDVYVYVKHM